MARLASDADASTPSAAPDGAAAPRSWTIAPIFAERARLSPEAIAVVEDGQSMSYAALDRRSNQLARRLQTLGVGPKSVVGLLASRSIASLVAILAILKTGAAYAPIDPSFPSELLAWVVQDCGADVVLAAPCNVSKLSEKAFNLDDALKASLQESDLALDHQAEPGDVAYIMYTSGSTGRPKGAAIPHRAVVRLITDQTFMRFGADEVLLHAAPLAFDASTLEIWGALLHGARVVVISDDRPSLSRITDAIATHGVTTAWFTAGLFNLLVESKLEGLVSLRQLLAGGDALSPTHVLQALEALPNCQLINGYGPTENTTFTCCYRVPREGWGGGPVPIGHPIEHTCVRILDEAMQQTPEGEVGTLYAGGAGLALGYIGEAKAATAKFVPDPFSPADVLYDTGDLVRRRPDGALDFIGRRDRQVKIDGKRIEPGEIEEVLRACGGVDDALVVAQTGPRSVTLVGYVKSAAAPSGRDAVLADIRTALKVKLPAYMHPPHLFVVDDFPLTANGKIDRQRLPAPQEASIATPAAAADELERTLAQIFARTLSVADVGLDTNFFDLGATSLKLIEAHAAIESLNHDVDVIALFEHPTVRELAQRLRTSTDSSAHDAARRRGEQQRAALRRPRTGKLAQ